MARKATRPLLLALTAAVLAVVSGCSDDSSEAPTRPARTADEGTTTSEGRARTETAPAPRQGAKAKRGGKRKEGRGGAAPSDEEFDREFDEAFAETPFERLVCKLPIRRPPLYVRQYITTGEGHTVYTAVSRRRFFCRMSPAQREEAVRDFFTAADELFRDGGVNDLVQVVIAVGDTSTDPAPLARARRGSISLTKLGRRKRRC